VRRVVSVEVHVHEVAELVAILSHRDQPVDVLEEHRELTHTSRENRCWTPAWVRDVRLRLEVGVAADSDRRVDAAFSKMKLRAGVWNVHP
jgi:hypothetical protein